MKSNSRLVLGGNTAEVRKEEKGPAKRTARNAPGYSALLVVKQFCEIYGLLVQSQKDLSHLIRSALTPLFYKSLLLRCGDVMGAVESKILSPRGDGSEEGIVTVAVPTLSNQGLDPLLQQLQQLEQVWI